MRDHEGDPRVVARPNGGFDVTTSKGTYHVLDTGMLGWGVFEGPDLDMVLATDERLAIGAASGEGLVQALLDSDTPAAEQGHTASAQTTTVVAEPADEDGWEA